MRKLTFVALFLSGFLISWSQKVKIPAKKYPSLLWEITGPGMKKPSYLFGTMHVSSKMVFHLSDSFYIGLKNADVVALETDMGTWQDDFAKYDLIGEAYSFLNGYKSRNQSPSDYLSIKTLQFSPYEKLLEVSLYSSPTIINNFLYRSNSERAADFEEDTYLDLHIYQAGKKWGKKVLGVENFDESMELMKQAYKDAAKEKNKKEMRYDYDEDLSNAKLEDAYRTGNLDWLDSINKINSMSAAFDEKFLYKRNEIQANSIDSILKTKSALFVGVGAAHLPGERGVIEMLRKKGYKLRPIKMTERDSRHKDEVEKIRVPVQFSKQTSSDGFFSVSLPGKLYGFNSPLLPIAQEQFSDMSNGSYYMVTRINTNSLAWGHTEEQVLRKIDSVMYENIPGKILTKKEITKNGYRGFEVLNRTRRGDYQRYNIFATPFEVILFKMSGNGEYVRDGTEADQFFNSIELKNYKTGWQKWGPSFGGFEAEFPHEPVVSKGIVNWQFMAMDNSSRTSFDIVRTEIHNYDFVEEDTFDLNLMEESFAGSDFIDKAVSRKHTKVNGYSALDVKYKYKDGSLALVRFLVQNTHYYTIITHSRTENPKMSQFINSFSIKPFAYGEPALHTDTSLYFTVKTPVALERSKKLSMFPDDIYSRGDSDDEDELEEQNTYKTKLVASDSTGEKIYITFSKPSRYYYETDTVTTDEDSTHFKTDDINWTYRSRKTFYLPNSKTKVFEYVLGDPKSSRYVHGKYFTRDGVNYRLETQGDTISQASSFITGFFETFTPGDTVKGTNTRERKSALFFQDYFSRDTLLHKRAVKNISRVYFDSSDFPQIKKAIQSLGWKEKKYLDTKKAFVWELAFVKTSEAADFLKSVYMAAGDTIDLQYTALEALLTQKTAYSYKVFKDIMVSDPPVLDVDDNSSRSYRSGRTITYSGYNSKNYRSYDDDYGNDFLENLTDSLELTTSIFKDLLPLININDYEQPMMDLMGVLVDSNMIAAKDYEMYQSKFLLEAKQLLKKQVISEKNRQIEKAQKTEEEKNVPYYDNDEDKDYGNSQLSLYATLLMPFWDSNPAVPQLINQLLNSNDKKLKYNTAMLLLHNKKTVPDSMFRYFAAMEDYRFELFADLKEKNMLNRFPEKYNNHIDLAKSELMYVTNYSKPDTIVYLDRLPVQEGERKGFVYFFKYKQKKDDNNWKLASVGMVPEDPKKFMFEKKETPFNVNRYDFTEAKETKLDDEIPVKEQLKKALKRMQYSKRNSAAEFYRDEEKEGYGIFRGLDFGD